MVSLRQGWVRCGGGGGLHLGSGRASEETWCVDKAEANTCGDVALPLGHEDRLAGLQTLGGVSLCEGPH